MREVVEDFIRTTPDWLKGKEAFSIADASTEGCPGIVCVGSFRNKKIQRIVVAKALYTVVTENGIIC